jgi:hypothetical protein
VDWGIEKKGIERERTMLVVDRKKVEIEEGG